MITEDYVSFETAKLLKGKGYDWEEACAYSDKGELLRLSDFGIRDLTNKDCDGYSKWQFPIKGVDSIVSAPTLQMAMKWLREVHSLWCEISWEGKGLWCMDVFSLMDEEFIPGTIVHEIKSYEEACEAAIKYCLENLI